MQQLEGLHNGTTRSKEKRQIPQPGRGTKIKLRNMNMLEKAKR